MLHQENRQSHQSNCNGAITPAHDSVGIHGDLDGPIQKLAHVHHQQLPHTDDGINGVHRRHRLHEFRSTLTQVPPRSSEIIGFPRDFTHTSASCRRFALFPSCDFKIVKAIRNQGGDYTSPQ